MNKTFVAAFVAAICSVQGCASTPSAIAGNDSFDANVAPEALRPYLEAAWSDGEWGAVLNFNRVGLAALDAGEFEVAERAFDESIGRIEAIYADNAGARKARSVWTAEGSKDFKGEPYERAMAYYYRGLLFLRSGDFDNARAAFRSAEYQDTLSEQEDFQSDFALMPLLAGFASSCAGDGSLAREFFDQARAQSGALPLPGAGDDTLVIVESGSSPTKAAEGQYGEQLVLRAPDSAGTPPNGGAGVNLLADLGYQATTRGGRAVDRVLAGKAQFKETTGAVGDVALATGAAMLETAAFMPADQMGDMAGLGAAAGIIGLFASAMSSNAKPKADTRYWDNLPALVYGGFAARDAVDFGPAGASPRLDATHPGCRIVVYREPTSPDARSRGNLTDAERAKVLRRNRSRDAAFHDSFVQGFSFAAAQPIAVSLEPTPNDVAASGGAPAGLPQ